MATVTAEVGAAIRVREIAYNDERLRANTLVNCIKGPPGFHRKKGVLYYRPDLYDPNFYHAKGSFRGGEAIAELLRLMPLSVMAAVDSESDTLPAIGQRLPTLDRQQKIIAGWSDPRKTPPNKAENISVTLFNAEATEHGFVIDDEMVAVLWDGAGRTASAMRLVNEGSTLLDDRGFIFDLTFRLRGETLDTFKMFQVDNGGKHVMPGTKLGVGVAEIETIEARGEDLDLTSLTGSPHSVPFVVRALYNLPKQGSITALLPWRFEGKRSRSPEFRGPGQATSIATVLNDPKIVRLVEDLGIQVVELPPLLDFSLRQFHDLSPAAVAGARRIMDLGWKAVANDPKLRAYSRLAVTVMTLMGLRIYRRTGTDPMAFADTVNDVLSAYLMFYKEDFENSKRKRMTMDLFWAENKFFSNEMFNSGAANAQQVVSRVSNAMDHVLGKLFDFREALNLLTKSQCLAVLDSANVDVSESESVGVLKRIIRQKMREGAINQDALAV
jgi:hypothetical protein